MALIKCKECSKEISDKAITCPTCGVPVAKLDLGENSYKGIKIISFLFPIIGLIIYAINIGKNNVLSKIASKWAIIGLIVCGVIMFLIFIIYLALIYTNTPITIEGPINGPAR